MKPTKEYNWSFKRRNSKGEILFKHSTNETVEDVMDFLDDKGIDFVLTEGAGSTMFWVSYNDSKYAYFTTSGRWAPYNKKLKGYPDKHFHSKGIEDFYTRFLTAEPDFGKKLSEENKKSVKEFLDSEDIEYKIKKDVVTLITKIIPRKDGRGNRKRHTYEYIIGTGKWRGLYKDNTYGKYYQSSDIKNFVAKFFRPKEEE